jgi:hypothetical protein
MTYEIKEVNESKFEILNNGKLIDTYSTYQMAAVAMSQHQFYSNKRFADTTAKNLNFINNYDGINHASR